MDALVITSRHTCCDGLSPDESKAVKTLGAKDTWLRTITDLKPEQYESYLIDLFEKPKAKFKKLKAESSLIVVCTDVPPVLALKIAFAAGAKNHQNLYLLCLNGEITKI